MIILIEYNNALEIEHWVFLIGTHFQIRCSYHNSGQVLYMWIVYETDGTIQRHMEVPGPRLTTNWPYRHWPSAAGHVTGSMYRPETRRIKANRKRLVYLRAATKCRTIIVVDSCTSRYSFETGTCFDNAAFEFTNTPPYSLNIVVDLRWPPLTTADHRRPSPTPYMTRLTPRWPSLSTTHYYWSPPSTINLHFAPLTTDHRSSNCPQDLWSTQLDYLSEFHITR